MAPTAPVPVSSANRHHSNKRAQAVQTLAVIGTGGPVKRSNSIVALTSRWAICEASCGNCALRTERVCPTSPEDAQCSQSSARTCTAAIASASAPARGVLASPAKRPSAARGRCRSQCGCYRHRCGCYGHQCECYRLPSAARAPASALAPSHASSTGADAADRSRGGSSRHEPRRAHASRRRARARANADRGETVDRVSRPY
eukprot:1195236-Prorocentrum_minimum.AAC.3